MKFKSLKMHNFMRYKGDVVLEFSCDPRKNVTIITGDNTFGKTTIAQAFRWGLYEDLTSTNYVKKQDIVLLNNEINAALKPFQTAEVSVEIVIDDNGEEYRFTRSAKYKRKNNAEGTLNIIQDGSTELTMMKVIGGVPGEVINNDGSNRDRSYKTGCVQDKINSMLPIDLSGYFFFDGERWSDSRTAKSKIKDSINIILGITGYLEMKKHLKDGRNNVISTLNGKIRGSNGEIERIKKEIANLNNVIADNKQIIEEAEARYNSLTADEEKYNTELQNNQQAEQDQKDCKRLESEIRSCEEEMASVYADFVTMFSGSAKYFAASMLPRVRELLADVNLEGKDIPGVTTDTVDYLIAQGTCLCGENLTKGSDAYTA